MRTGTAATSRGIAGAGARITTIRVECPAEEGAIVNAANATRDANAKNRIVLVIFIGVLLVSGMILVTRSPSMIAHAYSETVRECVKHDGSCG